MAGHERSRPDEEERITNPPPPYTAADGRLKEKKILDSAESNRPAVANPLRIHPCTVSILPHYGQITTVDTHVGRKIEREYTTDESKRDC